MKKRIVIGLSGASGAPLAVEMLRILKNMPDYESHVVMTNGFEKTLLMETELSVDKLCQLTDVVYDNSNIGAAIASGTFKTEGMVIIPCSMKTLSGVANGYSDNLLLRAADVAIKERRKLILVARESPLSPIHLRNMLILAELGAVIMPPVVTYYNQPREVAEMARHIIGKVLSEFGIEMPGFQRWE